MAIQRTVTVGDASIEYFVEPSDVVVLVPGFGVDVTYFRYLSSRLVAGGFSAVTMNPRGAGGSSGFADILTVQTLADDVSAVIEALDCGPVHLLGHAYGNRVTRCVATDRPELVRSLILLAAPGSARGADPDVSAALADWTRDDASEADCIRVMEYMVGDPAAAADVWRQLKRYPALARAQRDGLRTPSIDHYEAGGSAPLFVVQGLADRSAPPENARQLHERFPSRVRLMELPGAGHLPFLEQPEKVAEPVVSYLQEQ